MEHNYNSKMREIGYTNLVCDIFLNWEHVKDEILLPERKIGSGNGTVHVFLGAADSDLKKEFRNYYDFVSQGGSTSDGAIRVKHYFLKSNIISMIGYVCQYYNSLSKDYSSLINNMLNELPTLPTIKDMLETSSFFKLSTGSNRLRPYFKQFDDKGVFYKIIRQLLLPNSAYKVSLYKNAQGEYAAFWLIGFDKLDSFEADSSSDYTTNNEDNPKLENNNESFQQIFYGAPGTGKSYTINETTKGEDVIRTTFHPDSDYATFVGAYKPTTIEETVMTVIGTKAVPVEDKDGKERKEAKIVYEFVAQAFLQAYVEAWKKYAMAEGEPKKQYLVIEEINRGNCAQIFGDLFQLLDRNDSGFSDYPIKADADMKRQLKKAFEGLELTQKEAINALYDGRNVADEVLNGEILLLPNNLYIWATMNTSDQSLFPIDSAFKRRWDWNYMPISDAHLNWTIEAGNNSYDWWSFLQKINEKIGSTTNSEDKKLGYFFCKASNGTISAPKFVGKVVFYLWNDVFKDYEFSDSIFDDNDGSKLTFDKFYTAEGRNSKVVTEKVALFLDNLGVDVVQIADQEDEVYNGQDENEVIEEADLKPIERKRYEFWNTFLEYAHQNSEFTQYFSGIKKATKDYWKNFFVPGMDFYFAVLQQRKYGAIDLLVYFRETTDTYKHLFSRRTDIENEMGVNYEWNELPDKKASFINERRENVDFDNKDSWTGLFDFIIARLIRMREVFTKYSND